jgi:hypothetical protein
MSLIEDREINLLFGLGENLIETIISYMIISFLAFLNLITYTIFHFIDNEKNGILKAEY